MSQSLDQKLKDSGYQNIGWINGWLKKPPVFEACTHNRELERTRESMHVEVVSCPICMFYYKVDSSD